MKLVVKRDPVYRRRRLVALLVLLALATLFALGVSALLRGARGGGTPASVASAPPASSGATASTSAPLTRLVEEKRVGGAITPRGLAASSRGLVLATNMMYRHTVTAYDASGSLVATIPDAVQLGQLGVTGHAGTSRGAPVEAAFVPDGSKAYVTNYAMTGQGFGAEPSDSCATDAKAQGSFLYRVDASSRTVDQVVAVGAVPKDLAVTPDGKTVVVANWCSGDLSVVDVASARQTARVAVGEHPRGVAVSPDGRTAYVLTAGEKGDGAVRAVDLAGRQARAIATVGPDPRRIAVEASGDLLVTSAGDDTVRRLAPTGAQKARVTVPDQPRAIALSTDGATAYVVSYGSGMLTALRTSDLRARSSISTPASPTGLAVEPTRGRVWVAGYTGTLALYREEAAPQPSAATASPAQSSTQPATPTPVTTAATTSPSASRT